MFLKSILLRKGIRSDKIWCNPLLFREPFRRIPFYLDVYALMRSQYWPREELKKVSLERFTNIVRHAYTIPFWKERFDRAGIDPHNFRESDIARIPILTKKDFLDKDVAYYTDSELLPKSNKYHTSGSTGKPHTFYHDEAFELRGSAFTECYFRTAGDGKRFPVIFMKADPKMGFDYAPYYFFYLRGYNSVSHRIRKLQNLLSKFPQEVILYALGSSLVELARVCRELKISLPLRSVIASGEELSRLQKKEIEESLHTIVRTGYGMNELRRVGFQCKHCRFHVNEQGVYLEVTDDEGTPVPHGTRGRVVLTGFENQVMPFIRYDTGDVGVIKEDPCQCGRTLRTFKFLGRQVKLLHIGRGRTVSLINLVSIFKDQRATIRQFQLLRTDECAFTIRVVQGIQFIEDKIKKIIENRMRVRTLPNVKTTWEVVDFITEGPNGKALYFIDEFERNDAKT